VTKEFDGEVGVAVGLAAERVRQRNSLRRKFEACCHLDQFHHFAVGQTTKTDSGHRGFAAKLGEKGGQRMSARDVQLAVGRDHRHPQARSSHDQMAKEVEARGVRPVQVVEHDNDRRFRRHRRQQCRHRLEQKVTLRLRTGFDRLARGKPLAFAGQETPQRPRVDGPKRRKRGVRRVRHEMS
jgi:hypothetical protein